MKLISLLACYEGSIVSQLSTRPRPRPRPYLSVVKPEPNMNSRDCREILRRIKVTELVTRCGRYTGTSAIVQRR